tara:strand:- start:389 stop:598 length:210 start_codon:yes stop_codon:yes gene_type:complete
MNVYRLNRLAIDLDEVESIEWSDVSNEALGENPDLHQVVLHMKSGKKFTRRVYRRQFEELVEEFEGEEE